MRNIIIKVSTIFLFLALIARPLIYLLIANYFPEKATYTTGLILDCFQWAVIGFWQASLVSYMSHEGKSEANSRLIYLLIITTSISILLYDYLWTHPLLLVVSILLFLVNVVLITIKIKKVFYNRSYYFIVLELLLIPVGFLTLTPEIKRWEKGDKQ